MIAIVPLLLMTGCTKRPTTLFIGEKIIWKGNALPCWLICCEGHCGNAFWFPNIIGTACQQ